MLPAGNLGTARMYSFAGISAGHVPICGCHPTVFSPQRIADWLYIRNIRMRQRRRFNEPNKEVIQ